MFCNVMPYDGNIYKEGSNKVLLDLASESEIDAGTAGVDVL